MVDFGNQLEEIDDVDESDFEVWEEFPEESDSCERLVGWYVSAGCHYDIGFLALVIGCPVPDTETLGAVLNGLLHVEELEMVLLIGDDDIYVVGTAKTMVGD